MGGILYFRKGTDFPMRESLHEHIDQRNTHETERT